MPLVHGYDGTRRQTCEDLVQGWHGSLEYKNVLVPPRWKPQPMVAQMLRCTVKGRAG